MPKPFEVNVYKCPDGHGEFRAYAYNGAVCWVCPAIVNGFYFGCGKQGVFVRTEKK